MDNSSANVYNAQVACYRVHLAGSDEWVVVGKLNDDLIYDEWIYIDETQRPRLHWTSQGLKCC